MGEDRRGRVSYVIGPDGSPLTLADLPPPNTKRWVIRRKAEVVAAVRGGLLSLDEACKRGIHAWREMRTAAEQAFFLRDRQHDRHWVGARKVIGATSRAVPSVAAGAHLTLGAAAAAEAMGCVP